MLFQCATGGSSRRRCSRDVANSLNIISDSAFFRAEEAASDALNVAILGFASIGISWLSSCGGHLRTARLESVVVVGVEHCSEIGGLADVLELRALVVDL